LRGKPAVVTKLRVSWKPLQ